MLESPRVSWLNSGVVDRVNPLHLARAAVLPAACIGVMLYFAFHAVSGNAGLLAWQQYKSERATVDAKAARVATAKEALRRQVALLDPRHVDRDYADERVRRDLGVVGPNEVIVPLPEPK